MEKLEGYIFTALFCTYFLGSSLLFYRMSEVDPHMDEKFHIPQAQNYCEGNFKEVRNEGL